MKRFILLLWLSAVALTSTGWASPFTISYDFTFDQNTTHPGETPLTGNITVTLNTPGVAGYTTDGVVDSFGFNIPGLPGLDSAATNYVKMLFNGSGKLTYLLVSDRSDFSLSAIAPKKEGYILGLMGTDLLTGSGITVGSSGSYFDYYLNGRAGIDVAYTFGATNVVKVANPVAAVPDTASSLGLFGISLLGLGAFRRRFVA